MKKYYVYILECSDKSYYIGVTNNLERRLSEHTNGTADSYTSKRKPLFLRKFFDFVDIREAISFEKQIKKWSRVKKEALIQENWDKLTVLSMNTLRQAQGDNRGLR